jgi:hypothetical protein
MKLMSDKKEGEKETLALTSEMWEREAVLYSIDNYQ